MLDNIISQIKDNFFDIPCSHKAKNFFIDLIDHSYVNSFKPNYQRTHRNYYVINKNPLIIHTTEDINDIMIFSKLIGNNRKAYFILSFWWTLFDRVNTIKRIIYSYNRHQKIYTNHKIIFLLNDIHELKEFKKYSIPCFFIHQNSFVDKNIFKPINTNKRYDIIYNSRLHPMKRHYLLRECESLALITPYLLKIDHKIISYLNVLKKIIPNADILNYDNPKSITDFDVRDNFPQLDPLRVNKINNLAKVGVILSAKEGASYATIEYLLSGLPVVSTINIGGRNHFLDKRFCRIVRSNPKSIKTAVKDLIESNIPSQFIRSETIKKMIPHLNRMRLLISNILMKYNKKQVCTKTEWEKIYINKMIKTSEKFPEYFLNEII